jgi:tetratricopeptide (TPR) repeat protein
MFAGTERFRPRGLLGRGGMGLVYRVFDEELRHDVALKILRNLGPDQLYHLKAEFRFLAGITHRNLVALYELLADGPEPFFTMEFVDGVGFCEYVREDAPPGDTPGSGSRVDLGRLHDALRQLVLGTAALHERGRVHRDIKPPNVLVDRAGRVVLLDFGLASTWARTPDADSLGGFVGTLAYAAPEQQRGGHAHPAADWYSVGALLYEAFTGHPPFPGSPEETFVARARSAPPPPGTLIPGVPPRLDGLITALLDPDPARRPAQDELLALMDEATTPAARRHSVPAPWEVFVGRERELAALRASLDAVRAGHPVLVHVHGASGIGKTELIRRFVGTLDDSGAAVVLQGRCHPRESVAYKALDGAVDGLSRWLLGLRDADAARLLPRHTGALLRLFPVLGRVPFLSTDAESAAGAEPHEIRRRGFGALRELLARVGDRRQLVLWIDDLQWSDLDSAALLRALLEPPDAPAVLVVLSYRSEDREQIPFLRVLADAEELAGVSHEVLELAPLGPAETRELASRLCAPHVRSDARIAAITAESAGSPFFVGELARSFSERPEGEAVASAGLAEVMSARVDALAPGARDILAVVCAAGHILERRVALSAAGVGEGGRPDVFALEQQHFVRATTLNEQPALEVYHDRIRDALVRDMPSQRFVQLHHRIGEALRAVPGADPQLLFEHFLTAGDAGLAGDYAIEAAELASRALAFERAATLYREALRLKPDAGTSWTLRAKLAEALGNCGRGGEAGESFEAAAETLRPASPLDDRALVLRRRAAEHYLRSGHLVRGTAVTRDVLAAVGINLPGSTRRAIAEALYQRARLTWRGLGFELRAARALAPRALLRLDACWGATISFSMFNPNIAEPLAVRHLIEALDLGERSRIIHALGYEAARVATIGGRFFRRRSQRILGTVVGLAREAREPYDLAWVHLSVGTTAYAGGRWKEAQDECEAALAIFRQRCTGARWETFIAEVFAVTALAHRGELRALAGRLSAMLADARDRGDRFAAVSLQIGMLNLLWLAQDAPDEARAQLAEAIAMLPADIFHVQHYLHTLAAAHIDLYTGDGAAAWRRVVEAWPKMRRSQLLRMEMFRVEGYHLRARAALAAAAAAPDAHVAERWSRQRLLGIAAADARRIAHCDMPSATPFAAAIRGGVAHLAGRPAEAVFELGRAAAGFEQAGMALHRAAADVRVGQLVGGRAGLERAARGESVLRGEDVRDPAALVDVLLPM